MKAFVRFSASVVLLVVCSCAGPVATREVNVHFRDAHGLQAGAPVSLNGVAVGTVRSIEPQPDGATITLAIEEQYAARVESDAAAMIVDNDLAQYRAHTKMVRLVNLPGDAPPIQHKQTLAGMDSEWDLTLQQAVHEGRQTGEELAASVQAALAQGAAAMEDYFNSEDWQQVQSSVATNVEELKETSRASLEAAQQEYRQLLDDLRPKLQEMRADGRELAAAALQQLVDSLQQAQQQTQQALQNLQPAPTSIQSDAPTNEKE